MRNVITTPHLPFDRDQALRLNAFGAEQDRALDDAIAPHVAAARANGYLTKEGFVAVCRWKSVRPTCWYSMNDPATIEKATRRAFAPGVTDSERIVVLDSLIGVGYPVASALLHLCYPQGRYPLLDYHALGTLNWTVPPDYTFEFWWKYVLACRDIADAWDLDMRTVDRALFWYDWLATTGNGKMCAPP